MVILAEIANGDLIRQIVNINRWLSTTLADVVGQIPMYLFSVANIQCQFLMQSKYDGNHQSIKLVLSIELQLESFCGCYCTGMVT